MSRSLLLLLASMALLAGAPQSAVHAKNQECSDGTLVYWHEMHYWVCMDYVSAGQACILCHGEPIDVIG